MGDIVLCLASDGAGLAADAFVQINDHSPSRHLFPLKKVIRLSGYQEVDTRVLGYQDNKIPVLSDTLFS
jgi:hypothetical protein